MIETLYKTQVPEREKSECYVLVLTARVSTRGTAYVFMEEYGQWDNDLQRFRYTVKSINTDEQLTYTQALDLYQTAKRNLARHGFIHSFTADGLRKEPWSNVTPELEPEMATA